MNGLIRATWTLLRNTHRHPANRMLHLVGIPVYATGIVVIINNLEGFSTPLLAGVALWATAVTMFSFGHWIEGNVRSMTPVLIYRLILRKVGRYLDAKRIHVNGA